MALEIFADVESLRFMGFSYNVWFSCKEICPPQYATGRQICRDLQTRWVMPALKFALPSRGGKKYPCSKRRNYWFVAGKPQRVLSSLEDRLINPAPAVVAPPDLSEDQATRDRSARNKHGPQVPCLGPCGLWAQAQHVQTAFPCHFWFSEQIDRPTNNWLYGCVRS